MRLDPFKKASNRVHILFGRSKLAIAPDLIKWKIQEIHSGEVQPQYLAGSARLSLANEAFELAKLPAVFIKRLFPIDLRGKRSQLFLSVIVAARIFSQFVQQP